MRVWREVKEAYHEIGDKAKVVLSDFTSLVLMYAALEEWLITYILQEEFELGFGAAKQYAQKLRERMQKIKKIYEEVSGFAEEEGSETLLKE